MPIRFARYSDIPVMAQVLAASFRPDKMFQVMFPHQDQYPDDYVDGFRTRLCESYWDYSNVLLVSYTAVKGDSRGELITGAAVWERVGLGREAVWGAWAWLDPRKSRYHLFLYGRPLR